MGDNNYLRVKFYMVCSICVQSVFYQVFVGQFYWWVVASFPVPVLITCSLDSKKLDAGKAQNKVRMWNEAVCFSWLYISCFTWSNSSSFGLTLLSWFSQQLRMTDSKDPTSDVSDVSTHILLHISCQRELAPPLLPRRLGQLWGDKEVGRY